MGLNRHWGPAVPLVLGQEVRLCRALEVPKFLGQVARLRPGLAAQLHLGQVARLRPGLEVLLHLVMPEARTCRVP